MKDLIVNSLELLCKIVVILLLVAGTGFGIMMGNPYLAIAGLVLAFILSVIIFGVIFLLIDINDNLRALLYAFEKNSEKS